MQMNQNQAYNMNARSFLWYNTVIILMIISAGKVVETLVFIAFFWFN